MIVDKKIKQQLQASAPQPTKNKEFMADTIRQINLMPSPSSELQEYLRRYTIMERLAIQMDVIRWLLIGGTGSALTGYLCFTHFEAIISTITSFFILL